MSQNKLKWRRISPIFPHLNETVVDFRGDSVISKQFLYSFQL